MQEEPVGGPISCTECGTINWSLGDCTKCAKPLDIREEEAAESEAGAGQTIKSELDEPVFEDPAARAAAEEEARRKAMEDPEIRRKMLRSKLRAMQENRGRITSANEVLDARGRRVRGARQDRQPVMKFGPAQPKAAPIDVSAPDLV